MDLRRTRQLARYPAADATEPEAQAEALRGATREMIADGHAPEQWAVFGMCGLRDGGAAPVAALEAGEAG